MTHVAEMVRTSPTAAPFDEQTLVRCIEECFDCAQTCTACADACLGEDMVKELARCVRLNLDCADICDTTGRALSRQVGADASVLRTFVQACAEACRVCGEECERHAEMHEHCRICAEACRRCEQACNKLVGAAA
jgi:hypothetical protein